MSVSNTHGEQPTAVKSSVTYSCKSQCPVSTGTFPALIEGKKKYKGNNGREREARHHIYHTAEKTAVVWPRQKDARGQNTKINYGLDTTGEKKKRTSKKNMDGRSTSSHDNKKFRTR